MSLPPQTGRSSQQSPRPHARTTLLDAKLDLLAYAAAVLAAAGYLNEPGERPTALTLALCGGMVFALIGGLLHHNGSSIGAPIVAGAMTPFVGMAAALIGAVVDFPDALAPARDKFLLAAGGVGAIAVVVALRNVASTERGPRTLVLVLALVSPFALAEVLHIDDSASALRVGEVIGHVLIALIIGRGASLGWRGSITSAIAGALLIPQWVDVQPVPVDRGAFVTAAVIATIFVVVISLLHVASGATTNRAMDLGPGGA